MEQSITAHQINGNPVEVRIDPIPDECPICHHHIQPVLRTCAIATEGYLQVGFQCTRYECASLFIGIYIPSGNNRYRLGTTTPRTPLHTRFSEEIQNLSSTFVVIHSQAEEAEADNLDQLHGIGLRKALEFLIKDFATHEHPDQVETIKSARLGKVIGEEKGSGIFLKKQGRYSRFGRRPQQRTSAKPTIAFFLGKKTGTEKKTGTGPIPK